MDPSLRAGAPAQSAVCAVCASALRASMLVRLALVSLVALSLATSAGASSASAAEPYGEVTRFGGAVKEFAVGSLAPEDEGKFVMPVGFAVEPENPTTHEKNVVYVLDRTYSEPAAGEVDYRLQKISSVTHEVLATVTIPESFHEKETASDAHPLVGLAVNPAQKRIYTIVESMYLPESGGEYAPVAGKLVAWSTEPVGKQLLRASAGELPEDPITKASVVADESALKATGGHEEVLYGPEGLASDDANGDIAIEAQLGVAGITRPFSAGSTVVQLVHTGALDAGELGQRWVESHPVEGREWIANGLFAGEESEVFGVDLYTTTEARPHLAVVNMSGTPAAAEIAPFTESSANNFDEAPAVDLQSTPFGAPNGSNRGALNNVTAGTPIVQVGKNEYAALFAPDGTKGILLDGQSEAAPWDSAVGVAYDFWMNGSVGGTKFLSNMGVRVFEGDGKVIDTIGGGTPNGGTATGSSVLGSCNIDFRNATLAAGADGSIFVLTQPREGIYDDEVIEFAPGGKAGACPSVREGNVEVQEGGVWKELQAKGEPEASVTIGEGVPVKLSAMSLDQPRQNLKWSFTTFNFEWPLVYEWMPFAFEWNLEGKSEGGPANDGYTVVNKMEEATKYAWPSPEVEYTYSTPGVYDASVRLYGDFGTKVVPFVVHVLGSTPPEAKFSVPATIEAGVPAVFDGTGSRPTPGAEVEYYEWSFGEGGATEPGEARQSHTFAKPGKYKVTLVIHDKQGSVLVSQPFEEEVTVKVSKAEEEAVKKAEEAAKKKAEEEANRKKAEEEAAARKRAEEEAAAKAKAEAEAAAHRKAEEEAAAKRNAEEHSHKPLTRAQKLALALKACHRQKSKRKRASCEKLARQKYAAKKKPHRKK